MTSNLNDIFGLNQYCGPSVLSALTGRSTDSCAAAISAVSGQRVIKSVQTTHLIEAVKRLGFEAQPVPVPARSLFGVVSALINSDGMYIITVPNHVVAVEIKEKIAFFIDNHTKEPMNAGASARLTQQVDKVWRVKGKTKEEVKKEEEKSREEWLKVAIANIDYQIGNLAARRAEYERELAKLTSDACDTRNS